MKALQELQTRYQTQWNEAMNAKTPEQVRALRARALVTFRQLKIQQAIVNQ